MHPRLTAGPSGPRSCLSPLLVPLFLDDNFSPQSRKPLVVRSNWVRRSVWPWLVQGLLRILWVPELVSSHRSAGLLSFLLLPRPSPITPSHSTHYWGRGGWVDLSGHSGLGVGFTAWNSTEKSLPCGRQAVVFPASLATDYLGSICPQGSQSVIPSLIWGTPTVTFFYGDSIVQAAVQTTSAVGRGFIPPDQGGCGEGRYVTGPGGILLP